LHALTAVALTVASLTAAGCSTGGTVDASQVEKGIKDDLSSVADVKSAKCPSDVKSKAGATFTCDVTFGTGATGKAAVTESSSKSFTYELDQSSVRMRGSTAAAQILTALERQGVHNAVVRCPATISVRLHTAVTCGGVTFAFSSEDGTVDPNSVKTS
jgi:hypothetical protein